MSFRDMHVVKVMSFPSTISSTDIQTMHDVTVIVQRLSTIGLTMPMTLAGHRRHFRMRELPKKFVRQQSHRCAVACRHLLSLAVNDENGTFPFGSFTIKVNPNEMRLTRKFFGFTRYPSVFRAFNVSFSCTVPRHHNDEEDDLQR